MQPVTSISFGISQITTIIPQLSSAVAGTAARIATFCIGIFTSKIFLGIMFSSLCLIGVASLIEMDEEADFNHSARNRQVEIQAPKEPLPEPPVKVSQGCYNPGNSCWLNSALKLMACTPLFDALLNVDLELLEGLKRSDDRALKESVDRLTAILPVLKLCVNNLRNDRSIDSDLAYTLRNCVRESNYMVHGGHIEGQQDPSELLTGLIGDWSTLSEKGYLASPPPKPNSIYRFRAVEHNQSKEPTPVTLDFLMDIGISQLNRETPSSPIDIDRTFRTPSFDPLEVEGTTQKFRYKKTAKLVENVQSFILNIKRTVADQQGNRTRLNNPVQINYDRTVEISGHRFAVKGALYQNGGADGGHWVYLDVNRDNSLYQHSDSYVTRIEDEETVMQRLKLATVFFLEKVKQNPV